ncbi:endonuclease [Salimicrobium humidisoli]|uniref:Endonuclease n=2 Tax=Salimicrobium humidisoli TaxID=2029857 RepID=A0ABX4HUY2_9BACI|nr:endonuclease [Salimicrobium humidisoli]
MPNIHASNFDVVRAYVSNARKNNKSWEEILFQNSEKYTLEQIIDMKVDLGEFPEDTTLESFQQIVEERREAEKEEEKLRISEEETIIISDEGEENEITVPAHENSSWQLYKRKLIEDGFTDDSIIKLEDSTLQILRKLNSGATSSKVVKGLMVGHVQSGKTASMAALMAMAADWGWNYFVILSGMIENLRSQTEKRLWEDLNHSGNLKWNIINKPSRNSPENERLQSLHLNKRDTQRYFTVSLKNQGRLKNLNQWLKEDENKLKKMNMIVIDDEADQASINTKNIDSDERAKINQLVVNLVEGNERKVQPSSTNYISYTATPYSNFLNESAPESLYPKDFIGALPTAKEYFGPKEIFGMEEEGFEGMNVVRGISEEEVTRVKNLETGESGRLPLSMKHSLAWFIISVASLRHPSIDYIKPVSMLVHTSQRQEHHDRVAAAIHNYLKETPLEEQIQFCREVYKKETAAFTPASLKESVPGYPVEKEDLNNYPPFEEIEEEIKNIIETNVSHIMLGDDGDLHYHEGMHLCIDNCSKNGINDDFHIRLAYPDKRSRNYPDKAPAFIIIGGSTLSRGLTIEGLVSTYFLRGPNASDTLMQMGRWFGFRKGYEVFPRIWMTADTREKFRFLSNLEAELREELDDFAKTGRRPAEYGPRVKNTPKVSWMRLTAANRMQSAQAVDLDFSGTSNQMIHYHEDSSILSRNVAATESLIKECPAPYQSILKNSIVHEGVDFSIIKEYLTKGMTFHQRSTVFNRINEFCEWFEKADREDNSFTGWNVVVSGTGNPLEAGSDKRKVWNLSGFNIGMVNRSALGKEEQYENLNFKNIGVLRAPSDLVADIPEKHFEEFKHESKATSRLKNSEVSRLREKYSLGNTPQLLIYRIDKDSKPRAGQETSNRSNLNLPVDPVGICIYIPGDQRKGSKAKALQIKIDPAQENFETEE